MALFLALLIAVIPLAIAPGRLFYFDVTPKTCLLLIGSGAGILCWAAAGGASGFHRASAASRWFVILLLGTAISISASTLVSIHPAVSLGGSNWRNFGLVTSVASLALAYLAAAACAGRPDRLRTVLRAVSAATLVAALYGAVQYFGWDPLLDPRPYHVGEGVWMIVRPPSTFGHADYFGIWLLSGIFGAAALVSVETTRPWRWVAWGAIASGSAGVFLSGTRSAILGLLAGTVFLAVWRGLHVDRRVVGVAALVFACCAAFYISPPGEKLRARFHWSLDEPAGGARRWLWRDSLHMAASRWPLGYGPETFISGFARYQSVDLARAYPDFYHESPHNMFLDAAVSEGLPGVLFLAGLSALGFVAAWTVRRRSKAAGPLAASLAAMTIAQQFVVFMLPTFLAYYVFAALLVSLTCQVPLKSRPVARRWPSVVAAVPFAAVFVVFGARLLVRESLLEQVRRELDAGRVSDAAIHYSRGQSWDLPGASADLWYSRKLAQIAESRAGLMIRIEAARQSILAGERATKTAEDGFNAYYNMAEIRGRQNDIPAAEQNLRAAISLAPNWFKPHWILARVLEAAGRPREAESEATRAVLLDGGKHSEVLGTLQEIRKQLTNK